MSHTEEELWDLLREAYEMPYGAAQIALVEQVMAHADAQHLDELSFRARVQATTSYVYGGEPSRSFVTFSWCLAEFDRDPVRYAHSQHTLLWQFKATVTGLTKFPEIPLDRTYAVLDEMERRWRAGGHSQHAVHAHRHFVARHIGDTAAAQEWYDRWCTAPRDALSDCVGCDPSSKAAWLAVQGRDEEAVALAEPVLAGRLTCSEQPQGMLTILLKPYLRTGRLEQARDAHRRAYRRHRPNLADLTDIADHLEFCALTGNEARGVEILERHLGWLERAPSPFAEMWFAAAGAVVLRRAAGHGDVVVHRPAHAERAEADVTASALADELTAAALDIAARFDARNRTAHVGERVRDLLALEPLIEHLSLSPTADRVHRARSAEAVTAEAVEPVTKPTTAFAKTPVPEGSPDELLDLVEEHLRAGRRAEAFAVCAVFDELYAAVELTGLQRGRRADAHGIDAAVRGEMVEAETVWRAAADLFAEAGDELRRQSTRGRIGRILCGQNRGDEGLGLVEEATTYLLAHAGHSRWSGALYSLAVAYGEVGRTEEGVSTLDRAEEHIAESPDRSLGAVVAIGRSQLLGALDRLDEARAAAAEGVRRSRTADFIEGVSHASFLLGFAAERLGDVEAAVAAYDDAIAAATDLEMLRRVRLQRAGLLAGSSRAPEVIDDLVEAVAQHTADGDAEAAAQARHGLAIAYLNAGRPLDSAEVAEEALAYFAVRVEDDAHHLSVRHLLATAYRRLGQPDEAIAQLELISTDCAARDNPAGVGQMAEEIGDILDQQDRDAAAALRYLAAAEAFRAAELPIEECRNRRQHVTSLLWSDDIDAALAALAVADELGLTLPDAERAKAERAYLLYDGAKVLRNAGQRSEAALRAGLAARAFRTLGSQLRSAHAEMMLAELLLSEDRPADAEAAARRGLAELPPDGDDAREHLTALLSVALEAQGRGPQ